ncbi:GOLPH3/VPS74 family protein [Micromonospora eburnea]|uniref:Golgi phosphoprotein 3 (GPP34) n=1 Tax=Micromonospora eburnea TaxID=227316 RepID=A0A1C6V8E1_9ACTN|nr:GPP34 family phosphoprotein [Micromonospora eburnea]SCL62588.1 Golgi phosphoprotein 3 (GPP34) [Micromonospora eburnea]
MAMPLPPLPLRDELFLLGHNDDTGQPHIHRQALALGLAGAVLINLYLAGHVDLGDETRPADERWLRPHLDRPANDLIADTALTSIRYARTLPTLKGFLRGFSADLYERTRAGLVAAGILRHATRRRLAGLIRADSYLPVDSKWSVVARARLRSIATRYQQPDNHTAALAGLVAVLGLTEHLYLADDTTTLTTHLKTIADQHLHPVRDITAAIDATVGDLATAAYR